MSRYDFDPRDAENDERSGSAANTQERQVETHRIHPGRTPGPRSRTRQALTDPREEWQEARQLADRREVYKERDRVYRLRTSELEVMVDVGTFRAVKTQDLIRYRYQRDYDRATQDLKNLTAQGLIERKTVYDDHEPRQLITLTETGCRLIKRHKPEGLPEALMHHGFVKPREALHDADLYRLYNKEAERIVAKGGKNVRVVLDLELKKHLNRELAKLRGLPEEEQAQRKEEIAQTHALKVIAGKIPVPDLRIEYETQDLEPARVDLELATGDYRGQPLAEKARAGFAIYASKEDLPRLRAALADQQIMTEILSL